MKLNANRSYTRCCANDSAVDFYTETYSPLLYHRKQSNAAAEAIKYNTHHVTMLQVTCALGKLVFFRPTVNSDGKESRRQIQLFLILLINYKIKDGPQFSFCYHLHNVNSFPGRSSMLQTTRPSFNNFSLLSAAHDYYFLHIFAKATDDTCPGFSSMAIY
jgi:hypothetical protein